MSTIRNTVIRRLQDALPAESVKNRIRSIAHGVDSCTPQADQVAKLMQDIAEACVAAVMHVAPAADKPDPSEQAFWDQLFLQLSGNSAFNDVEVATRACNAAIVARRARP